MRQPLSKHRLTTGRMMQTFSNEKVYGLTQRQVKLARNAFLGAAVRTGNPYAAHDLAMRALSSIYQDNKHSQ